MSDLNVTAISGDVRTPGAPTKRRGDGGSAFDAAFDAARGADTVTTPREVHGRGRGTSWSRGAAFGLTQQVPGGHPDAVGAGVARQLRAEAGSAPGPVDAAAVAGSQGSPGPVAAAAQDDAAVPAADEDGNAANVSAEAALAAAAQLQIAGVLAGPAVAAPTQASVDSVDNVDAAPGVTFLAAGVDASSESLFGAATGAATQTGLTPAATAASGVGGVPAGDAEALSAVAAGVGAPVPAAAAGVTPGQSMAAAQADAVFSSLPADQPAGALPGAAMAGSAAGRAAVADLAAAAAAAPVSSAAVGAAAGAPVDADLVVTTASTSGAAAPVAQPLAAPVSDASVSDAFVGSALPSTGAAASSTTPAAGATPVSTPTPAVPGAPAVDAAVQFSAPDAVAPIDTPAGAVSTTPSQPGQATAPESPAVDAAPSAPLPGTWGAAVTEAAADAGVGSTAQTPVPVEGSDATSPTDVGAPGAPTGVTAPGATDSGAGESGASPDDAAQAPTTPIPLPVQGEPGDPNSTAPDGELPGVIAPPSPVIVPGDVATPILQPIVVTPGQGVASRGLVSPVDDSVAALLKPAPEPTPAQSAPATPPVPASAPASVSAPASPAANAAALPTSAAPTSDTSAQQAVDARSAATVRDVSEPEANPAATTAADRGVPAFTAPSQPVATPVAPTPSAILTGTPGALPYQQVAGAVGGLLRGPDGTYHVQLNLTPAHLGNVRIMVELRAGEVQIQMLTIDNRTGDLLRGNLDSLRQDLQQMGLRTGHMDVGGGRDDSGRRWADQGFASMFGGEGRDGGSGHDGGRGQAGSDQSTYRGDRTGDAGTTRTTRAQREGETLDVRV